MGKSASRQYPGGFTEKNLRSTEVSRITDLNHGQGLAANLVTAGLVLGASPGQICSNRKSLIFRHSRMG
jgi:hypothetical protein